MFETNQGSRPAKLFYFFPYTGLILVKFNIKATFNNLRIASEKDYDLTTFAIKFGNYKSNVLPFRLYNRPAYF